MYDIHHIDISQKHEHIIGMNIQLKVEHTRMNALDVSMGKDYMWTTASGGALGGITETYAKDRVCNYGYLLHRAPELH